MGFDLQSSAFKNPINWGVLSLKNCDHIWAKSDGFNDSIICLVFPNVIDRAKSAFLNLFVRFLVVHYFSVQAQKMQLLDVQVYIR